MRESFHKGDNTLALLDFDLCVFNSTYLFIKETVEKRLKAFLDLLQVPSQEVLIRVFNIEQLAVNGTKNANALPV